MKAPTHLTLEGEVDAQHRVGVTPHRVTTDIRTGGHPTPDLRSDPPLQGEGGNPQLIPSCWWAPWRPSKHEASTLPTCGGDVGAADRGGHTTGKGARHGCCRVKPSPLWGGFGRG
jgi:hypothetical protein